MNNILTFTLLQMFLFSLRFFFFIDEFVAFFLANITNYISSFLTVKEVCHE